MSRRATVLLNARRGEAWVGCEVVGRPRTIPLPVRSIREWRMVIHKWRMGRVLVDGEGTPRDVCATRVKG